MPYSQLVETKLLARTFLEPCSPFTSLGLPSPTLVLGLQLFRGVRESKSRIVAMLTILQISQVVNNRVLRLSFLE